MDAVDLLIRRLDARDALSPSEITALRAAAGPLEKHPVHATVVREGTRQSYSRLLAKGYIARSKVLPDGGRQITGLHLPGDFVDLHSFLLKCLEHDIVALTPVEMIAFPHEALKRITEDQPHLTRMLWLSTLIDAATHREWIVNAGRKPAIQRIASLICEMLVRHRITGLADDGAMPFPLTQIDLADACGLSPVHVNRVIQELREQGLVHWRARRMTVLDFDRLAELAQFDDAFLVLFREAR